VPGVGRMLQSMNNTTNANQELTSWTIDPAHTTVGFSVRHLMITHVRGVFERVSGTLQYDPSRPEESRLQVTIPVASVNTREPVRDNHLRSPDFFDVERHPDITFNSTRVQKTNAGGLELTGDLTLHGVTREVTLTVSEVTDVHRDHNGNPRMGASATGKIRRSDFGVTYNKLLDAGGVAISDEVSLSLDVSLLRAS
jgi:polyisoprenoid-binding protein YceI